MFNKSKIYGRVIGLGFFLALTPDIALAQKDIEVAMPATAREQTSLYPSFQNKVLGGGGGGGLVEDKPVSKDRSAYGFKACCRFRWFRLNWCRTLVVCV